MKESEWVNHMRERINASTLTGESGLEVRAGQKLPYGFEIQSYGRDRETNAIEFETDLVIVENAGETGWKPRVVLEAKMRTVTTHDAITYSHKAAHHKAVHPYLRYGIILGERRHYPLPGRLYRHGAHFDFMVSFTDTSPTSEEMDQFSSVLHAEIEASRAYERLIYESRRRSRDHYTVFHRKLQLK